MKNVDLINKKWVVILTFVLVLLVLTSPFWLWFLKPSTTLNVLIFDKTVPDDTYRHHKGLTWLLNNEKIKPESGEPYNPASDYIGIKLSQGNSYSVDKLPSSLDAYDLIYLADMYGVDEQEVKPHNGLQQAEYEAIRDHLLNKGGTLIAEYNLFGPSTTAEVKENMYTLLNVQWTGWTGRYTSDLAGADIPAKVKTQYEEESGKPWSYSGEGILLLNEYHDDVLVLTKEDIEAEGTPVQFSYTDQGREQLGLTDEVAYRGWFDIMEPAEPKEVLATYKLGVTASGQDKLKERSIPLEIPAVIHHQNNRYASYYFCGDYLNQGEVPELYESFFYADLKRLPNWHGEEDEFYWKAYVPLMKEILHNGLHVPEEPAIVEHQTDNGVTYNARSQGDKLQILKDGQWVDFTVKGVNIGMGKPGVFPGEAAITRDEYYRWFQQIGAMNANSIRVYTLQPPGFYEALYDYNQTAANPLYLFHGAWVLEEELVDTQDAYSDQVTEPFYEEIRNVVDAVHGNAVIAERKGHASGQYKYDVSPYLLGWIIGIEWDPFVVQNTNANHKQAKQLQGQYVYTQDASPFELWLANSMEYTASYEADHYNQQHLLSFTNWITTDLLDHPSEADVREDMSVVDPNHIYTTDVHYPGSFASYHIYPYYPEFMNNEYQDYVDQRGEKNAYAGYLQALKEVHRLPIVVAEFGIPASRGITHSNPQGKDQGGHSEKEQGELIKGLYEDIIAENYAGGMIFAWQDEWFKRTWNTMEYDNPDRRPYWPNIQTNEQFFGIMSFDPGINEAVINIDGHTADWDGLNLSPIYQVPENSKQNLKRLYMTSDSEYLYLRLDYGQLNKDKIDTKIMLDTIDNQGITKLPGQSGLHNEAGFDFYIDVKSSDQAEMFIDSYYDSYYYSYAHELNIIPQESYVKQKDNGIYHPIRLLLRNKLTLDVPGGEDIVYPLMSYTTGKLKHGNSDVRSEDYDSLTDYAVNEEQGVLEIRIPWLMLNVKDPSKHEIIGDMWGTGQGVKSSATTEGFRLLVLNEGENGNTERVETLPVIPQGTAVTREMLKPYFWDEWDVPIYHERLKDSYYIMQDTFSKY
ncbi:hypothetical protein [Paenibacillus marinisediminis]